MSYILDALRKSQQTRQPGPAPVTRGAVHNISFSFPTGGWWLALGIVLLTGMLVAAILFWLGALDRLPEPVTPPVASEPPAAAPEAVTNAPIEKTLSPPDMPAPNKTAPVSDLAEQAKLPVPAVPAKKPVAARAKKKPTTSPRPSVARSTSSASAVPMIADDTPLLQQMPEEFQRALPPLAVTIHVYSHDESQQILFLNNREYLKGSQIDGGIRVEDIVPDGVVLSFRGERFKLSRPR